MKTLHHSLMAAAGLAAALSLTGCASITAPDMDYAAPAPSVTQTATGVNRLFSRFTGSIGVASASLTRAGGAGAAPTVAYLGVTGATSTYRFDAPAAAPYATGDTLSVTWSGDTINIIGSRIEGKQNGDVSLRHRNAQSGNSALWIATGRIRPRLRGVAAQCRGRHDGDACQLHVSRHAHDTHDSGRTIEGHGQRDDDSGWIFLPHVDVQLQLWERRAYPAPAMHCTEWRHGLGQLRRHDAHRLWPSLSYLLRHKPFMRCYHTACAVDLPVVLAFNELMEPGSIIPARSWRRER